eukprot:Skav225066  [mRNA]  locus=scaffold2293:107632:109004:- [translate_table: standard]
MTISTPSHHGAPREVDGVCTFAELSVPLTARLAELLGLPGPLTTATDQAPGGHPGGAPGMTGGTTGGSCWGWLGMDGLMVELVLINWLEVGWFSWDWLENSILKVAVGCDLNSGILSTARDKALTRAALRHHGLPTPPTYEIRSDQDIDAAAKRVGFPAVLKPVCPGGWGWGIVGAGGLGMVGWLGWLVGAGDGWRWWVVAMDVSGLLFGGSGTVLTGIIQCWMIGF